MTLPASSFSSRRVPAPFSLPAENAATPGLRARRHRGVLAFLLVTLAVQAPLAAAPSVTSTATWHDNATNADRVGDILAALQLRASVEEGRRFGLNRTDALLVGWLALAEAWPRYDGLDRAGAGTRVTWQRKFGRGPFAPTAGVELEGALFGARESGRAGRSGAATLFYRQRLDRIWQFELGHEWARYDARAHAFDRTGAETSLLVNCDATEHWRLTLAARYRDGGVLSYSTPPRPDLLQEGKALTTVTTWDRGEPLVAYHFVAPTLSAGAAFSRSLDERTLLTLSYDYRTTEQGPIRYVNQLVSLAFDRQF